MERERDQTSRSIGESQSEAFKAATHLTGQQAVVCRSLDGMDDIRKQIRKRIGTISENTGPNQKKKIGQRETPLLYRSAALLARFAAKTEG